MPTDRCGCVAEPEALTDELGPAIAEDARRAYYRSITKRRLHQALFRERVLHAYRRACAICNLRHIELLDAAHILPDSHPRGAPVVRNGLALCRLHHGAFDTNILGIRPDSVVEVREAILREHDGPMLQHGLQAVNGMSLRPPRTLHDQPDVAILEERYELFRQAV
jgi:putative restriction endonuclease